MRPLVVRHAAIIAAATTILVWSPSLRAQVPLQQCGQTCNQSDSLCEQTVVNEVYGIYIVYWSSFNDDTNGWIGLDQSILQGLTSTPYNNVLSQYYAFTGNSCTVSDWSFRPSAAVA